ncbi:DUF4190 domain-containing protein [Nocardia sp. IFM 10818]
MSYPEYQYNPYPEQPFPGYRPPADHPQATTILVLGILSLTCCQLLGPVAWIMGHKARREIDRSGGMLGGRGNVTAGYVCGIVGTCLMIALGLFYGAAILIAILDSSSSSY